MQLLFTAHLDVTKVRTVSIDDITIEWARPVQPLITPGVTLFVHRDREQLMQRTIILFRSESNAKIDVSKNHFRERYY